ncbi:basic leucine zipper transcriptional factor ATF-like 2 isoform X3 [Xyrichtys novacula]|uniref:Basic leucine zipper transcriptional factor ATF-like 2 isoform X3 n=1 Tax=Xyrichtys novacula TaxID=13765 RepID=A0AAV1HKL3_XYRNO|nr:basic leucine zipper transcriptional factor ATF-like 2 isoform X3 [Xyrichtys novacula]
MSPLFMDTGYDTNSPSSMSAEENHSNNAGSEKEGEEHQVGNRGTKRQEKNRDAARKSRKKQTERADELHEELQSLEQSNSALHKEIASLKKDLHMYTMALKHHKPFCTLKASSCSSTTDLSISPSTDRQTGSSSLKASSSSQASAPSLSTSLTPNLNLQTHGCLERSHLSPQSTVCSAPVSTSVQHSIHESSTSCFSTQPPYALDTSQTKQASFQSLISNAVPPYSPIVSGNTGQTSLGCPVNLPQLNQGNFMRNPTPQDPASQSLSVSPRVNLELSAAFTIKPSYSQHMTPNPSPRLSQLTVPSPPNVPQSNSSSLEGLLSQPSLPLQTSGDLSLSELLEINDWILQ